MNHPYQHVQRSALPTLLLTLGLGITLALVVPEPALALTVHEPYGHPDGEYFREVCPKGSYLVGVDGRYGGWVNRIAPVCAPWLWTQKTFGPPTVGPFHGGSGGDKQKQILCWGFGINNRAVQSWTVWVNRSADRYVNAIHASCASLAPPHASGKWGFGPLPDLPRTASPLGGYDFPGFLVSTPQVCPPGELGVGIHGRAGDTIQALGLICGPLPVNPGAPATKVNPLATAPEKAATKVNPLAVTPVTDDMFTIRKPADGDQVALGQVVLLVKPPKIGTPPVTVLEFQYLDAPSNKPYGYTIAVETSKLLQNYVLPPQSQPAFGGQWLVRARTAAQPTPGPWSQPARFQVLTVQPFQSQRQSSPIQQTAPLPSSAVTAPPVIQQTAPLPSTSVAQPPASSSSTTQMKRSPSMIMPRGIEEKGTSHTTPGPGQ